MFPQLGMPEMVVVMVIAVVLFGKRLPEVGRSLGKGLVEFKKGLRGIEDEFDTAANVPSKRADDSHTKEVAEPNFPKFEPPTSSPMPRPDMESQPSQD